MQQEGQVQRLMCCQVTQVHDYVASLQFTYFCISEIQVIKVCYLTAWTYVVTKMPPRLNTRSTGALDTGTENVGTWTST